MRWDTRKHASVERIACPWLIKRFSDPEAEFIYVSAAEVARVAERGGSFPYVVSARSGRGGRFARSRCASPQMVCANVTATRTNAIANQHVVVARPGDHHGEHQPGCHRLPARRSVAPDDHSHRGHPDQDHAHVCHDAHCQVGRRGVAVPMPGAAAASTLAPAAVPRAAGRRRR